MSIHTEVAESGEYFVHVVVGPVNGEDVCRAIGRALKHSEWSAGSPVLWDASQADPRNLTTNDVRMIADYLAQHRQRRGAGKTAVWAVDNLTFGMARMVEAFVELSESRAEVRAFRDRAEAIAWLKTGGDSDSASP